jgi:phage portal protein BeeE
VQLGWRKVGYLYWEGGRQHEPEPVPLLLSEVCHWMPNPDPDASFRGMSWLTPVVREVEADRLMTTHKRKYFENGATPNMVIKHDVAANEEKVKRFAAMMDEKHGGVGNAYRTLNLYPGADLTVVGNDFKQIDFKQVQGAGETRIAAAAGVPPVIAGFSEGLQAATYSNYAQARRRLADGTIHPLWQNMAGSMEPLIPAAGTPPGHDWRLWYDVSDVPFLREDAADAANITHTKAATIVQYVNGGFTPESAILAASSGDESLLVHTGLVSVQLQPPGTVAGPAAAPAAAPAAKDTPAKDAAKTGGTKP